MVGCLIPGPFAMVSCVPIFVCILYTYTMLLCIKHMKVLQQPPSHTGLYFAGYMPGRIDGASRGSTSM